MEETHDQAGLDTSDLIAVRRAKLAEMRAEGRDPFRENWSQEHTSTQALALYAKWRTSAEGEEVPRVSVAGRIVAFRLMGKAAFIKILDRDGRLQAYVRKDEVGEEEYLRFKKFDLGDIVGFEGELFETKTGEVTVRVQKIALLAKSLRPLPEKWHGLTDEDQILRRRYLDLIVNEKSRERFKRRSRIVWEIRRFLVDREFMEVETPVLQGVAGGAAARPFETHMKALDCPFFLRVSLELYLKRMLVGGFDRVFELGRTFRNEGLSRRHNPEFTMLELYQAYSDERGMMELVRGLILHVCDVVLESRTVSRPDGTEINFDGPWEEAEYGALIRERTGDADWFDRSKEEKLKACSELGIEVDPNLEDFEVTNNVFEKLIEPTLIQPTFVTRLPKELIPLAKTNLEDPGTLDIFELCINGQEIAPAYSEQNDPLVQREMFQIQAGEEIQKIDEDFLEALEYGMPPAGGMGIGIDRLVILLTEASSIRETILFPTLRP
ncbi:MAG: lysine--tRNA ligase [Puniceicoccaceae bacterium]